MILNIISARCWGEFMTGLAIGVLCRNIFVELLLLENFVRSWSWNAEGQRKVPVVSCQLNRLCSLDGFRRADLILLVYAWWDFSLSLFLSLSLSLSLSLYRTNTHTNTHPYLQQHCIIDREAVGGRCFALLLNKSTPWINHQIKPYLQLGRGHQPYPASFTLCFTLSSSLFLFNYLL